MLRCDDSNACRNSSDEEVESKSLSLIYKRKEDML